MRIYIYKCDKCDLGSDNVYKLTKLKLIEFKSFFLNDANNGFNSLLRNLPADNKFDANMLRDKHDFEPDKRDEPAEFNTPPGDTPNPKSTNCELPDERKPDANAFSPFGANPKPAEFKHDAKPAFTPFGANPKPDEPKPSRDEPKPDANVFTPSGANPKSDEFDCNNCNNCCC